MQPSSPASTLHRPTPNSPPPLRRSADEILVDVIASGLHPRVRSQADGSHYTSSGDLPLVPGIDGVGRAPDGTLRYFICPTPAMGAMAEQTVIDHAAASCCPTTPTHLGRLQQ